MCIRPQRHAKGPGQTKIRQLQVPLPINQKVLGLQIPVQHPVAMTIPYTKHELQREFLDHGLAQPQIPQRISGRALQFLAAAAVGHGKGFHVFLQVEVEVLEDKVELVAVGVDDVEEADDVGVFHLFEEGDLADGGGGDAFIFGLETDLLEGDDAA